MSESERWTALGTVSPSLYHPIALQSSPRGSAANGFTPWETLLSADTAQQVAMQYVIPKIINKMRRTDRADMMLPTYLLNLARKRDSKLPVNHHDSQGDRLKKKQMKTVNICVPPTAE